MSYVVSASEKTKKSGAEYETKALLYLMNLRTDSNEIHYFVVDFFNDLTGMDRYADKLWDVQSKGAKNNSPNAIGKELVTLFKNFLSDLTFNNYILFLGGVSSTVRKDNNLTIFNIENVKLDALNKLKSGLKEESKKKTYINNKYVTDEKIDNFLKSVVFVIDDKKPSEYIKLIIQNHPNIIPNEEILEAIFNEIRNVQSGLKNTSVEGVIIQTADEVLRYCRHLTNSEIKLMVLNRIINRNPVEKNSIPPSFADIYASWVPEKNRGMLDDCVQTLCKALFNKNAANEFWNLFENIYSIIIKHPTYSVNDIYQSLDSHVKSVSPDFDVLSLKYFISVIKDGIQNDN